MTGDFLDDESWLDMEVGETGTIAGRLDWVSPGVGGGFTITLTSWMQMSIACRNTKLVRDSIPLQKQVHVRVRRNEDGLDATAIWMVGHPPIPLEEARYT